MFVMTMTFFDITNKQNRYCSGVFYVESICGADLPRPLGGFVPTWDTSAHIWVGLLQVNILYFLLTFLPFVDSTNVDKIFAFNLNQKPILYLHKYVLQIDCPRGGLAPVSPFCYFIVYATWPLCMYEPAQSKH